LAGEGIERGIKVINEGGVYMRQVKIIVEKHPDGYVAYPLGLKGIVVGQGDTYEEALSDVKSAIRFHIETFGKEVLDVEPPVLEAFVAELFLHRPQMNFA
jgi:predicted RNase H-like HicB family nuclease